MSPIDGVLLAGLLGLGVWRLAWSRRWRPLGPWLCAALAVLAVVQAAVLGFTWQFITGYGLLAVLASPWRPQRTWSRRAAGVGLTALVLATLAPWAVLPAPDLPPPRGAYPVGASIFRWIDADRPEPATSDPTDHRNVVAQAWYPAASSPDPKVPYMDGLGRLPPTIYGLPRFIFGRFGQADTHAAVDAPVSPARRDWPVVVFSPGYGAPRFAYAGLLADLASHGYVVIALDHPYESAIVEDADGRVIGPAPVGAEGGGAAYMDAQVAVRTADVSFVLDRLARGEALGPLAGRLDLAHIAAIGHSFGGATAVLTASRDARIAAAADIDGMLYGPVEGEKLRAPLLLLESAGTQAMVPYLQATRSLLAEAPAGGWRYAVGRSNHLSFTDAERLLSAPARWVAARLLRGERGAADTQAAAVELLDAFLRPPLKGEPGDIPTAAVRARYVRGGREP